MRNTRVLPAVLGLVAGSVAGVVAGWLLFSEQPSPHASGDAKANAVLEPGPLTEAAPTAAERGELSTLEGSGDDLLSGPFDLEGLAKLPTGKKFRALARLLPNLSPDQLKELIAAITTDERFADVGELSAEASRQLMSEDPQGFLCWVKDNFDEREASEILLFAVENATPTSAAGIWSAIVANWPAALADGLIASLMTHLADSNPRQAMVLAQSLFQDPQQRLTAMGAVVDIWSQTNPKEAMDAIIAMPSHPDKGYLSAVALTAWYGEDPLQMEAFLRSLTIPEELRQKGVAIAVDFKAASNPDDAAKWLSAQPPQNVGGESIVNLTQHLALGNPDSALRWNQRIADRPLRDVNQYEIIRKWAATDPQAASAYFQKNPLMDRELQNRLAVELGAARNGPVQSPP